MPRSTAHRASSLRLQWLSGSWLSSDGCSQANATIAQICSGVNVAGAPGRGASANRWATGAASSAARQRHSQCRTVFGQTPSRRAISRTPVPPAASRISWARSANFRDVPWARTKRVSACSSAVVMTTGSEQRRGIGPRRIKGQARDSPCHSVRRLTPPPEPSQSDTAYFSPDCGNPDSPSRIRSRHFQRAALGPCREQA